jgi:hypothetical protein
MLCFGRRPSAPYRVEAPPVYASPPSAPPYGYGLRPNGRLAVGHGVEPRVCKGWRCRF